MLLPFAILAAPLLMLAGCWTQSSDEVVVYTAQDADFADPLFKQFTDQTQLRVLPKYDSEAAKTTGLVAAIMFEAKRPRADVFWNNEIVNTLRLKKMGLLDSYVSKLADSYPAEYRDGADHTWHGFAARARVLIVNKTICQGADRPESIFDLADAKWRGRVALAKPLFGATATHAACLFAALGDEKAKQYYRDLKKNDIQIVDGNKQVAVAVGAGKAAFGVTDTDDALEEVRGGQPVEIVYPDQKPGELGTLFFPNTLSIMKDCPHPEAARRLVDFLLSPQVEAQLAAGPSGQIPLNPAVREKPPVETPATVRAMKVDFAAAADKWDEVAKFLRDEFTGAD